MSLRLERDRVSRGIGSRGSQIVHDLADLGEGEDYALVVLEVVLGENTAFAILEPLLSRTIAADGLLPHLDRHIVEILRRVDIDAPVFPFNLVNGVISGDREPRARLRKRRLGVAHEVRHAHRTNHPILLSSS